MALYAQVTLASTTNLPRDASINTFAFGGGFVIGDTPSQIGPRLRDFYNSAKPGMNSPLSYYLANSLSRTVPPHVKIWAAGPGELGEPNTEFDLDPLGPPSDDDKLPQEVALCLSFRSNDQAFPLKRRRGRIYLGPLTFDAMTVNPGTNPARPNPNILNDIALSAQLNLADQQGTYPHAVWSRVGNFFAIVDQYEVDNEFDTQRRRGRKASARTIVPAIA
jgi:hypothetical protein